MIYKEHTIELLINGKNVDLESEDSLGIRFNDVLINPTKINSTNGSYSFEFELPTSKNNNRVFDYANVLAKTNKFHNRYKAEVNADGTLIFEGTLVINSIKDNKYACNLVAVKTYSLEEIFGESNLSDIPWYIDFNGVSSINHYNSGSTTDAKFPLVSYGVFAKDPYSTDEVGSGYTSKFLFDKWNKWYVESFYPSINMMETIKKAFEWKGYKVWGDAFQDDTLKNIYMSCNLADEQIPSYNVGNPRFGSVDISINSTISSLGYPQDLQFPYEHVQLRSYNETEEQEYYNFDNIQITNLLESGVTSNQSPSYMYQPNENCIVIPKSGFYKIELSATTVITAGTLTAALHSVKDNGYEWNYNNESINKSLASSTPIEIAVVRNYDDNYELIKGKWNIEFANGSHTSTLSSWLTCFPHEDAAQAKLPTKKNDLAMQNQTRMQGLRSSDSSSSSSNATTSASGNFSGARTRGGTIDPTGGGRIYSQKKYGYMYRDGEVMTYDQAVSPIFICGLSSYQGGVAAVANNGYSWSRSTSTKQDTIAAVMGYDYVYLSGGTTPTLVKERTNYHDMNYVNCPSPKCNANNTTMSGNTSLVMWLERNDIINLFGIRRTFYTSDGVITNGYPFTVTARLKISAFSERTRTELVSDPTFTYESPTEFPTELNLGEFMNSGTSISSFIQGVADAFNLEMIQDGNTINISRRKKYGGDVGVVNIDNRINNSEVETERIEYPKSMAVQYKVNKDEWGFEQSVPQDKINLPNWDEYGDSGFTKILLNDDSYVTDESNVNTNFSYTWYDDFTWTKVDTNHSETSGTTAETRIPVISKALYMVDGYDYNESEKYDGYGLTQRLWYKPTPFNYSSNNQAYVYTDTYPQEKLYLYTPTNVRNGVNLSYKNSERSLLDYFNIKADLSSNYVNLDVYLTPEEYRLLKNGGRVHFDSDLYDVISIEGYDPSGNERTTLKLMKRV